MLGVSNFYYPGIIIPAPAATPSMDTGDQPGRRAEGTAEATVETH